LCEETGTIEKLQGDIRDLSLCVEEESSETPEECQGAMRGMSQALFGDCPTLSTNKEQILNEVRGVMESCGFSQRDFYFDCSGAVEDGSKESQAKTLASWLPLLFHSLSLHCPIKESLVRQSASWDKCQ
jgi:hypothetical protein